MSILNPSLNRLALANEFANQKKIQIRDVLNVSAAHSIDLALRTQTEWSLVYNKGSAVVKLDPSQLATLGGVGVSGVVQECVAAARTGFQFLYFSYPIVDAILARRNAGHPLHTLLEDLNSPEFLSFVKDTTGVHDITKADGQATLYRPGSFLTFHNDFEASKHRRIAYVLSFTKHWRPDWGGMLEFYDAEGNVSSGLLPRFNSLSLFLVPTDHAVSYVAPFAKEGRYSITGWFRAA